ncbi:MAG: hypothetical protein LBJ00_15310 [Planctomycetaceae bacterium]|nr:hypothetical protein [Planctomycetaceae bacterium]
MNLKRFFVTILFVFILGASCSKNTDNIGGVDNSQSAGTNTSGGAVVAKPSSNNTDKNQPLGFVSDKPDAQGKRVVIVKGSGADYESAKKDAMQNAIREVVNAIVEPEARASLSEAIAKSLDNYDAFAEQCEILSRKHSDGILDIRAEVIVLQKALQTQLVPSEIQVETFDGANIAKRLNEKIKSDNDAVMLVADFLRAENFPYSCLDVNAELNPKPIKTVGDNLTMAVKATVTVNEKKFDTFSKKFIPILEKIKTKSGTIALEGIPVSGSKKSNNSLSDVIEKLEGKGFDKEISEAVGFFFPINNENKNEKTPKFILNINTTSNKTLKNTDWNYYEMPPKFGILFYAYQNLIICIDTTLNGENNKLMMSIRIPCYRTQLTVTDHSPFYASGSGWLTTTREQYIEDTRLVETGSAILGVKDIHKYIQNDNIHYLVPHSVYIFPFPNFNVNRGNWLHSTWSLLYPKRSMELIREITITSEELSAVKSVTSRVRNESPTMDEFYKDLPELLNKFPQ